MRTIASLLFVLSLFTTGLYAQNNQNNKASSDTTIAFEVYEHNYGELDYGGDGTCTFTFTNKGTEPLILTNVRASCGCTTPSWTRDPIQPGEKGEIKVKYNTLIQGSFNKVVSVNSNGNPQFIALRVKGLVKPRPVDTAQK